MTEPTTFSVALHNETATAQLMADLALLIGPGDVITLTGDLGAGKTAAARSLIRYLAGDEELEVPSPTFTLVQGYELPPFPVLHADLYRVEDGSELEEIGLSPLPDATLLLIEWPERAPSAMPEDRIDIALTHRPALGSNARAADITGHGRCAAQVARLKALREFLDASGYMDATRRRMAGDASTRSYARLLREGETVILMNFPQRPDGAALYNGKSYSAAVHLAENVRPFVAIAEGLRAQGISAPAIHHSDLDHGFLITEDFGSEGVIEGDPPRPIAERYEAATDVAACVFPQKPFEALLASHHGLEHTVMMGALRDLELSREWIMVLGCQNTFERVVSFMLHIHKRMRMAGVPTHDRFIEFPIGRRDIAGYLGTTVETISRHVQALARQRIIRILDNSHFEICNLGRLQSLSKQHWNAMAKSITTSELDSGVPQALKGKSWSQSGLA